MSITIQTFLRDSFFKNGNFFALFFFTLCIIFFYGRSHIRIQVSGAAFNHFKIEAKLNLHCLLPLPATTVRIPKTAIFITQVHPFSGQTQPFP